MERAMRKIAVVIALALCFTVLAGIFVGTGDGHCGCMDRRCGVCFTLCLVKKNVLDSYSVILAATAVIAVLLSFVSVIHGARASWDSTPVKLGVRLLN